MRLRTGEARLRLHMLKTYRTQGEECKAFSQAAVSKARDIRFFTRASREFGMTRIRMTKSRLARFGESSQKT